jgi:hypothetical protein
MVLLAKMFKMVFLKRRMKIKVLKNNLVERLLMPLRFVVMVVILSRESI